MTVVQSVCLLSVNNVMMALMAMYIVYLSMQVMKGRSAVAVAAEDAAADAEAEAVLAVVGKAAAATATAATALIDAP